MSPQEHKELELPMLEEVSQAQLLEGRERKHFLEFFIILAKHKRLILRLVIGAAVGSVIISLLLPTYYEGTAKMMPPQQGSSIASAMMDQLGGLAPLIGATAGSSLGLKNPSDLYAAMLRSRTIADTLIDRFSLMSRYNKKLRVDARKRLAGLTEITVNKDGTITIAVEDRDPTRAAEMANAYIEELEKLSKTLAVSDASKRRIFFEREAKAASDELADAEQALKKTEETTGIIQLDSQSRVMLEGYADLRAQVTAKEAQVQAMSAFATPQNPDLMRAQQELAALRTQLARYERGGAGGSSIGDVALAKVPTKALEWIRKYREVKYRESLLTLLLKQYEIARIDEGKEAAIIQILDKALPPERKSSPHRSVICISITLLAIFIAVIWAYAKEFLERAKEDPNYLARLQLLKFYLSGKPKSANL
jgi:uncharacterized protein involved in exopolysaccharide biosynthesis